MPLRRVGRRRVNAVRRRGIIRRARMPLKRGIRQPVQFFKQMMYYPAWLTSSTTTEVVQNIVFSLNALTQATTFTALYDQYCIKGVKCVLVPRGNVDGIGNSFGSSTFSILDYDGTFPTTIAGMNEYQNVKMKRGTSLHSRYLTPACLPAVYNGVTTTAYGIRKKQWIDAANPAVPHYGLAFGVQPTAAQAISWDLKVEYYLAFKNVR